MKIQDCVKSMDIKSLRCFVALAEEKHFGHAAARLNIVQPALSMQIKALEEDLGGRLFLRDSRHVELTESGALLLIETRRILEQLENTEHNIRRSLRGKIGRVRVGHVGNAAFTGKLGEDLRNFHHQYPEAELTLEELLPEVQLDMILNGQLDVGYCSHMDMQSDVRLKYLPIGEYDSVVLMSSEHRLARKKKVSNEDLRNETLIFYSKRIPADQLKDFFQKRISFTPAAFRVAGSTLTLFSYVVAEFGVAIVPK